MKELVSLFYFLCVIGKEEGEEEEEEEVQEENEQYFVV